jgi:hypothetical protein
MSYVRGWDGCYVCDAYAFWHDPDENGADIDCPRCGPIRISGAVLALATLAFNRNALSACICRQRERDNERRVIVSTAMIGMFVR